MTEKKHLFTKFKNGYPPENIAQFGKTECQPDYVRTHYAKKRDIEDVIAKVHCSNQPRLPPMDFYGIIRDIEKLSFFSFFLKFYVYSKVS